jgi:hypothetical protein
MRALAIRLLVAALLVWGQTGGILHAMSHLRAPVQTLPAGDSHSHHCLVCDAYDSLGHGAAGGSNDFRSPALCEAPAACPGYRFLPVPLSLRSIRAPPS